MRQACPQLAKADAASLAHPLVNRPKLLSTIRKSSMRKFERAGAAVLAIAAFLIGA
jgi:hypothetical protein